MKNRGYTKPPDYINTLFDKLNVPDSQTYTVHILDEFGKPSTTILFSRGVSTSNHPEHIVSDIQIHLDDSIHTIKHKILSEMLHNGQLKRKYAYEEMYLFGKSVPKSATLHKESTSIKSSSNNSPLLSKDNTSEPVNSSIPSTTSPEYSTTASQGVSESVGRSKSDIFRRDEVSYENQPEVRVLSREDISNDDNDDYVHIGYKVDTFTRASFENEFDTDSSDGLDIADGNGNTIRPLKAAINPYRLRMDTLPPKPVNYYVFENSLLLNYPPIHQNELFVCFAENVFEFVHREAASPTIEEANIGYISQTYFPLLREQRIYSLDDLVSQKNSLVKKTTARISDYDVTNKRVQLFYDVYNLTNRTIRYIHRGIRKIYFAITPETSNRTNLCLLYTSPSPRDRTRSRMPSSA